MKKIIPWILVLGLIGGGIAAFFWWRARQAEGPQQEILRTAEVARGALDITIPASGNVIANQNSDLSFGVPGTVTDVAVALNDRVKAGQILAQLDTADLEHAVQQAELALDQAELSLEILLEPSDPEEIRLAELAVQSAAQALAVANANKEVAEAQGSLNVRTAQEIEEDTRQAYESFLETLETYNLHPSKAAGMTATYMEAQGNVGIAQVKADYQTQQAQSQWLAAYSAYEQAVHNLETLQEEPDADQVRQTELQIEQARLNLEQAQGRLDDAVIRAPFDGVVAAVNIQTGAPAPVGLPAISVLDDQTYYVDVTVDEMDIGGVAVGQAVEVTLDAYPKTALRGTVERIAATPTNVGGIIAYELRVRLEVAQDVDVRDGMTASVVIQTRRIEGILVVPPWAVRTDQATGEVYAYRIEDGVAQRVPITTGQRNETAIEIATGLAEGDVVAQVIETRRNLFEFQGPPSQGR